MDGSGISSLASSAGNSSGQTNSNIPNASSAPSISVGPSTSNATGSLVGIVNVGGEFDSSLVAYNQAIVNVQLRQYATALAILETLFQNIEPIEEYLAIKICFLLIDIYLIFKQKDRIPLIIFYLEKTFPQLAGNENESKKENIKNDEREKDESSTSVSSQHPRISPVEFQCNLHLSKAKLYLLTKTVKSSKKEVKLAMALGTIVPSSASSNQLVWSRSQLLMFSFLKANLEYLRQNYSKSLKLLNASNIKPVTSNSSGSAFSDDKDKDFWLSHYYSSLYFNNVACIHFRMKKYHAASFYFAKALKQNDLALESPGTSILQNYF